MLKVKDVAKELGIDPRHVLNLIASGQLKASNMSSEGSNRAAWRVRPEWLEEYIERRSTNTAA